MPIRRGFATVAAVAVAGLSTFAVTTTPALAAAAAPHSYTDRLTGVSCVRADWCMAVGQRFRTLGSNLAELWNGKHWRKIPIPSVTGASRSDVLFAVSCTSSSRCLAVGYAFSLKSQPTVGFAERWNGRRWQLLHVGFPGGSLLFGVSCTGTTCMIVGQHEGGLPIAMQLAGSRLVVHDPRVPSGTLSGDLASVSCTAATSCMSVGTAIDRAGVSGLAETWNGHKWRITRVPHPADAASVLYSVSCPTAAFCFAAGAPEAGNSPGVTLTLAWRRGRWHSLKFSGHEIPSFVPQAVSCASASRCLAAGVNLGTSAPGALSWNGKSLRLLAVPKPSVGPLNAISCTKPAKCIAVGGAAAPGPMTYDGALAELWTGTAWRQLAITG